MPTASLNGTYQTGPGASVVDAQGVVYAINSNGQITINGKLDPTTARVDALGFFNGLVWQKNGDNNWYSKTSAAATWANYPPGAGNPMPVPVSMDVQFIGRLLDPPQFYDAHGNVWAISPQGQVVVDGRVDPTTQHVVAMELVNGLVWQENTDGNWYSKAKPSDVWSAAVRTDPAMAAQAAAQTWFGGAGGNDPKLGLNWSKWRAPTPGGDLHMTTGTMNLGGGTLGGNTLFIGASLNAAPPTINITNGGDLRLNYGAASAPVAVHMMGGGQARLHVETGVPGTEEAVVTVDARSALVLDAQMSFGKLAVHGGTVLLNGDNHFSSATVLLDTSVAGFGTIFDTTAPRIGFGSMEITGAIGAGVTIAVVGNTYVTPRITTLVLDSARADQGAVTLDHGSLLLKGVGVADSLSYKNSMVSLFHGNTVVGTYKVTGVPNTQPGNVGSGVLNFTYAAGNLTVYDGGPSTTVHGIALHV